MAPESDLPDGDARGTYLRGVLADGVRRFRHRTGVGALLGVPDDVHGVRVSFAPNLTPAVFRYARYQSVEPYVWDERPTTGAWPATSAGGSMSGVARPVHREGPTSQPPAGDAVAARIVEQTVAETGSAPASSLLTHAFGTSARLRPAPVPETRVEPTATATGPLPDVPVTTVEPIPGAVGMVRPAASAPAATEPASVAVAQGVPAVPVVTVSVPGAPASAAAPVANAERVAKALVASAPVATPAVPVSVAVAPVRAAEAPVAGAVRASAVAARAATTVARPVSAVPELGPAEPSVMPAADQARAVAPPHRRSAVGSDAAPVVARRPPAPWLTQPTQPVDDWPSSPSPAAPPQRVPVPPPVVVVRAAAPSSADAAAFWERRHLGRLLTRILR